MPKQINWATRIIPFIILVLFINITFYGIEPLSLKNSVNLTLSSERGFFAIIFIFLALYNRLTLTDIFLFNMALMLGLIINQQLNEIKMAALFSIVMLSILKFYDYAKKEKIL